MPKIDIELSEDEYEDLQEYCRERKAKSPADALKEMAGLKTYRELKERTDKQRKKKSVLLRQDVGIPNVIPCAFAEMLESRKTTLEEFIVDAIKNHLKRLGG